MAWKKQFYPSLDSKWTWKKQFYPLGTLNEHERSSFTLHFKPHVSQSFTDGMYLHLPSWTERCLPLIASQTNSQFVIVHNTNNKQLTPHLILTIIQMNLSLRAATLLLPLLLHDVQSAADEQISGRHLRRNNKNKSSSSSLGLEKSDEVSWPNPKPDNVVWHLSANTGHASCNTSQPI